MNVSEKRDAGFTLLELLIVISIIAILSVALVVILDPAEALRKSRDAQRISDMNTMKTALGLYLTSTTTPYLGATVAGALNNDRCKATATGVWDVPATSGIFYSITGVSGTGLDGTVGNAIAADANNFALTDGSGWIPVMFDNLTGGSPISNLPVDPINTVTTPGAPASTDLVYRYACSATPLAFEIDASLESVAYKTTDDKRAKDGGNNTNYYEVGTNLRILSNTGSNPTNF